MDVNSGVPHEGGIGVVKWWRWCVPRNGKATQVQVCPRRTDVPACTHTYTHTYMYTLVCTYTHKYTSTRCRLNAHTTGIDNLGENKAN